ncbi:MAG: MAPEG family protein [Pseudomonadota bacterium]
MTTEITVLGYVVLLQALQFLLMAFLVNRQLGIQYAGGPRDTQKEIKGIAGRVFRAHNNHFEALILFSIAVMIVTLGDASSALTQACAWMYLLARVLYIPAYASGVFLLRSVIWAIGFVATLAMVVVALF